MRTIILLCVGLFILVWNALFGNQNWATYGVGLMLCGFPMVINLDNVLRSAPPKPLAPPESSPVKETVS
jgi:hypothetical protein